MAELHNIGIPLTANAITHWGPEGSAAGATSTSIAETVPSETAFPTTGTVGSESIDTDDCAASTVGLVKLEAVLIAEEEPR